MNRREALRKMGAGFGMMSLASLLGESVAKAAVLETDKPWMTKDPNFKPKAKNVIFLFMNGGMSAIDTFDYKPMLAKYNGSLSRAVRFPTSARSGVSCSRPSHSRNMERVERRSAKSGHIWRSAWTTSALLSRCTPRYRIMSLHCAW